jgi:hypothetical protein
MKHLKSTILKSLSIFAVSTSLLLSSCEADPCNDLNCQNNASCSDGKCICPPGYEGAECDLMTAYKFVGKYEGVERCDQFPYEIDQVEILLHREPNEITLRMGAGNTYVGDITGIAETPETHIVTYKEELEATIHAYIRVNGDNIDIYLESISLNTKNRQTCKFIGRRVK